MNKKFKKLFTGMILGGLIITNIQSLSIVNAKTNKITKLNTNNATYKNIISQQLKKQKHLSIKPQDVQISQILYGDIDNDGKCETVISSNRNWQANNNSLNVYSVVLLRKSINGKMQDKILEYTAEGAIYTINLSDFNGDKTKDIMINSYPGGNGDSNSCFVYATKSNAVTKILNFAPESTLNYAQYDQNNNVFKITSKYFKKYYIATPKKSGVGYGYINGPDWQVLDYDKDNVSEIKSSLTLANGSGLTLSEIFKYNKIKKSWYLKDFYVSNYPGYNEMKIIKYNK